MGVISSIISGTSQIAATNATNNANREIASEANAFNERMLDKQMQYNTDMYERQLQDSLKYSDPSYIRDRLQMAGYNPALVGTGNVGTAVSAPQVQGINPPRAQTYQADYSGMGTAVANAMQVYNSTKATQADVDNKSADTQGVIIDNQTRAQRNFAALIETLRRVKGMKFENRIKQAVSNQIDVQLALQRSFMSAQVRQVVEQTNEQVMKNVMTNQYLAQYPQVLRLDLAARYQDINLKYQEGRLTEQQVRTEVWKTTNEMLRSYGQSEDNKSKQLGNEYLERTMEDRVKAPGIQNKATQQNSISNIVNSAVSTITQSALGTFGIVKGIQWLKKARRVKNFLPPLE